MKHNYHTHTIYCNHATMSVEEAIQCAIEKGLETIGFSEHTPLPEYKGKYRLIDMEDLKKYIAEVSKYKEIYKDKIRVLIGIEAEIIHPHISDCYLDESIREIKSIPEIDYIIIGHHNYFDGTHVFNTLPTTERLRRYVEDFKKAVDMPEVLYIAHPDGLLLGAKKWTNELKDACEEMIKYAAEKNKPLGININGVARKEKFGYPNKEYFGMVAKYKGPAILELDAHEPEIFSMENEQIAKNLAKETGVNLVEKLI